MRDEDSVSEWICQIKDGDEDAAQALWNRYFPQLMLVARERLGTHPRTYADEEDVALNALNCFFCAVAKGQYPHLDDRLGLWRLLSRITHHKAVDLIRYHVTRSRPAKLNRQPRPGVFCSGSAIDQFPDSQWEADLAVIAAEELQRLFDKLPNTNLRRTALAKLAGRSNQDIAEQFNCSVRTVERRVNLIRDSWARGLSQ